MHKNLKQETTLNAITSSGMLMRLLATRPSGLTTIEAAKRASLVADSNQMASVVRDGFLREIGVDQIVAGDILVLDATEKAPVAVATIDKEMAVIKAGTVVKTGTRGVVLNETLSPKDDIAKVRLGNAFLMAVAALVSFFAVLAVNEFAFVGVTIGLAICTAVMMRVTKTGQFKNLLVFVSIGQLRMRLLVNLHRLMTHLRVEPVWADVQRFLVHAGNAEIPQPVLA
ncbi:hypothetical protein NON14_05850 [Latilactobacillus sakei]|uniref:hypothetical protein n=1 Tax=Latilactobacillus sakei TaxID=1599 RepID=UPI0038F68BF3